MARNDQEFFHPVQEIARSEANRLTDILSQMMLLEGDITNKLRRGLIQSIHTRLAESQSRLPSNSLRNTSTIFDRRLLEKALRTLLNIASVDRNRELSQSITLQSIQQT